MYGWVLWIETESYNKGIFSLIKIIMNYNFFKVNTCIKSYTYPIIKIIIFFALILLLFFRKYYLNISNSLLDIIVGIVFGCIGLACFLCIYISIAEIVLLHERRKDVKAVSMQIKKGDSLPLDKVISLINDNDIIEIRILSNNEIIKIGASSDCKMGRSGFYNKMFFINNEEYETLTSFKKAIIKYTVDSNLFVLTIDDLAPVKFFK